MSRGTMRIVNVRRKRMPSKVRRSGFCVLGVARVDSRLFICKLVLPPSKNSFHKLEMSRENSGISPKRHMLRKGLNELYSYMYNIK
jgi:hypothetical protein